MATAWAKGTATCCLMALLLSSAPGTQAQSLFSCNFDTPTTGTTANRNYCGMGHTNRWRTTTGGTTSTNTGPIRGIGGTGDRYAYLETSTGAGNNGPSYITTPALTGLPSTGGTVRFYYHMFGTTIGSLSVQSCTSSGQCTTVWSRTGAQQTSQYAAWLSGTVALPGGTTTVRFTGTRGTSFTGDIALDGITIVAGTFPPTPPPPPPPPCPATTGFFSVTSALPQAPLCAAGVGNSPTSGATCYTTSAGNCFTTAAGRTTYGNNERCSIFVRQNGFLTVSSNLALSGTSTGDYLSYSGSPGARLRTYRAVNGLAVTAGSNITWTTDAAGTGRSVTICGSSTQAPAPAPRTLPWSCNFNTPTQGPLTGTLPTSLGTRYFCGMSHDGIWTVDQGGGTTSVNTGPSSGQGGGTDNYAYTEASYGSAGLVSTLEVALAPVTSGSVATFYYHMYGATIGTLQFKTCIGSTCTTAWSRNRAQHNTQRAAWTLASVTIPVGATKVQWVATRGTSYTGDISIDTIQLYSGSAPPTASPTPLAACANGPANPLFVVTYAYPVSTCAGPTSATQGTCYTTSSGTCFTDGPGAHGNNERCTIAVQRDLTLTVAGTLQLENCCDYFQISGSATRRNTVGALSGVRVSAGSNITWQSDGSVNYQGYTICGSLTNAPTAAPVPAATSFSCNFNTPTTGILQSRVPATAGTRFYCGMSHSGLWLVDRGGGTASTGTGPSQGQGGSGDHYAHIEASYGGTTTTSLLTTPPLNMQGGGVMTFYYHMYGATIGTLNVQTCAGSTCTTAWTRTGQQQTSNGAPWTRAAVALPSGTTSVRFQGVKGTSFTGDISIDTISIARGQTAPPTPSPTPRPSCPPLAPSAFFNVTASLPVQSCSGGGGPQSAAQGTCYTTTSGTCVTDGAGNYGNNERCTVGIVRSGFLSVVGSFVLETCCDWFALSTAPTTRLTLSTQLDGLAVTAGQSISWRTDGSVVRSGYTVCGVTTTTLAPTPTPVSTFTCGFNTPTTGPLTAGFPTSAGTRYFCGMQHTGLWNVDQGGGTPSVNTGPGRGQGGGADNYAHIEASYGTSGLTSLLSTPPLALANGGIMSFYTHMYGATIGTLTVRTCAANACTSRLTYTGQQQTSANAAWTRRTLNLPPGTTSVVFQATRGASYTGDISIDTISISAGGTVPPSAAPTATPACAPAAAGATFAVSAAVPTFTCSGGGGPTSATQGTCFTTTSGSCFTDGAGNHGNNERCTINVLRNAYLQAVGTINLEPCCDYLQIRNTTQRLQTSAAISNVRVVAGAQITWTSDYSVTSNGFTVCAVSTPAPTAGCGSLSGTAFFRVTSATPVFACGGGGAGPTSAAQGTCYTTSSGTCFTDGPGAHGSNERCSISVLRDGVLQVVGALQLETCCDYFTISGSTTRRNTAATLSNVPIRQGQTISWRSDGSVNYAGYTICAISQTTCAPAAPGAFFNVSSSVPIQSCTGGGGPQTATQGTCYTTSSGTCFTDGPGNHGNNERCTISILRSGFLNVVGSIAFETCCDYMTLSGSTTRLQTTAAFQNLAVTSGQQLQWRSDVSINTAGYTICASTTAGPTPSPTAPPPPATGFSCDFNTPTTGTLARAPFPTSSGTRYFCGMSHSGLWNVDSNGSTPSVNTGPSAGQGGGSDNYAHLEASYGNANTISILETPALSLASGGVLTFYYHMFGATIGTLAVQSCVGTTCTTQWTRQGQQQRTQTTAWAMAGVQLPAGTTSVRFTGTKTTSFTGDISIDTVSISAGGTVPPSPSPTANPTIGACGAVAPGAVFVVTSASPIQTCTGGSGPTTAQQGTCYTTTSGTCLTDGVGNHGNNEQCTIAIQSDATLYVHGAFQLEGCCDYFTLSGSTTRLNTRATIDQLTVQAGQNLTWRSDFSVVYEGYTICTTPAAALPACAPAAPGAYFAVTQASPVQTCSGGAGPTSATQGTCYTTSSGNCFTDGPGDHGNNEACTVSVLRNAWLQVSGTLDLELCCDYLTVSGSASRLNTNATINGVRVTAGQNVTWRSDYSVVNSGFTVCATLVGPPTAAPVPAVATFSCDFNTPTTGTLTSRWPTTLGTRYWCGMQHSGIWAVDQGGNTASVGTGPSRGQAGTTTDNYAHIETSFGTVGLASTLTTPTLSVVTGATMTFYYHMYGATIGTLLVNTCVGTVCTTQWSQSGQQHTALTSAWAFAGVSLPAGTTSVQFVANRTTSFTGDISIDTISISPGGTLPPSPAPTPVPACSAALSSGAFFMVTAAAPVYTCSGGAGPTTATEGTCFTTSSGLCFTDGPGVHGNAERCTVSILQTGWLYVGGTIDLELFFDYLRLGNSPTRLQTTAQINGLQVTAGQNMSWYSDNSVVNDGFTVCGSTTMAPTVAPPPPVSTFACGFNTPASGSLTTSPFPNDAGTRFWCGMSHTGLWNVDQGGSTASVGTGPTQGQAGTSTDNYAHIETSYGTSGSVSYLTTPPLVVAAGGSTVSFYYHMFGQTIASLTVQACTASFVCTSVFQQAGAQQTSSAAPWTMATANIPQGTVYVRWLANRGTSFTGDISVDTISITPGQATSAPASSAPTSAPTTAAPVSSAPSVQPGQPTSAPNTAAPVSSAPSVQPGQPTSAPNTAAPVSSAPTSAPTTAAPVSSAPTSAPTTATPTAAPNGAPSASASSGGGGGGGGGGMMTYVIIAAIVAVLILVGVIVWARSGSGGGVKNPEARSAFNNPLYANNAESKPTMSNPMYDEAGAGYMDLPGGADEDGYMELPEASMPLAEIPAGGYEDTHAQGEGLYGGEEEDGYMEMGGEKGESGYMDVQESEEEDF